MFALSRGDRVALQVLAVLTWLIAAGAAVAVVAGAVGFIAAELATFPMDVAEPMPHVVDGVAVFTAAAVSFDLSDGTRVLFAGAQLISLAGVLAAAAAGVLFWAAGRGMKFVRALTVAAGIAGPSLALGALLQAGLLFAATSAAYEELGGAPFEVSSEVNLGQILTGLAITALAYLFSRGRRLQQDTEGLV